MSGDFSQLRQLLGAWNSMVRAVRPILNVAGAKQGEAHGRDSTQRRVAEKRQMEAMSEAANVLTTTITHCARCGTAHEYLQFSALSNPEREYAWWASCPTNGEPILLAIFTDGEHLARKVAEFATVIEVRPSDVIMVPVPEWTAKQLADLQIYAMAALRKSGIAVSNVLPLIGCKGIQVLRQEGK